MEFKNVAPVVTVIGPRRIASACVIDPGLGELALAVLPQQDRRSSTLGPAMLRRPEPLKSAIVALILSLARKDGRVSVARGEAR
jgi:hypothetical protein